MTLIETILWVLLGMSLWLCLVYLTTYIKYRIKYQWCDRYKKVCDACFRDIEKMNKSYKKHLEDNQK